MFWAILKILESKLLKKYLKFTTRRNFITILTIFVLILVIFHSFFVYPQNMLQKYSVNQSQCLFKHTLKHK